MALTEEQAKQIKGLSSAEVLEKLKTEGYNELPSSKRRNILAIAFEVIKEPMFLLLVACGSIYLFLGEPKDALLLLGFVFIMMGITIYQEGKTEKALDALRDLSSPRALVIRDGEHIRIPGREVVMITGDYPVTARTIARQIGLKNPEKIITGKELEQIDELTLRERVKEVNVFARVVPEQKLIFWNSSLTQPVPWCSRLRLKKQGSCSAIPGTPKSACSVNVPWLLAQPRGSWPFSW